MNAPAFVRERLRCQQLVRPRYRSPADLVRGMGAIQAQDHAGALWAIGARVPGTTADEVEAAVAARTIVRTWPMRRTLHFVPAEDVRWMLELLAARVLSASAGRYRQLGLDEAVFRRSRRLLERALVGGRRLARPEAYAVLERGGVSTGAQRGIHILAHLSQQAVLCFGPHAGRQPTFALLEEWVPRAPAVSREAALGRLATRYFAGHAPATVQDFAWWSGLSLTLAREAIGAAGLRLDVDLPRARSSGGKPATAALLPPWDEYLVAYRDRAGLVDPAGAQVAPLALLGRPVVLIDGRVRGTWRRSLREEEVLVEVALWTTARPPERRALEVAAARYGRFLGRKVRFAL